MCPHYSPVAQAGGRVLVFQIHGRLQLGQLPSPVLRSALSSGALFIHIRWALGIGYWRKL